MLFLPSLQRKPILGSGYSYSSDFKRKISVALYIKELRPAELNIQKHYRHQKKYLTRPSITVLSGYKPRLSDANLGSENISRPIHRVRNVDH